jgi:hypothetical protein
MGEGSYYGEAYYGAVNIRRAPLKDMRKGMKRYGNTYGSIYVCLLFGEISHPRRKTMRLYRPIP